MVDSQKNQALREKIKELEKQAAGERQEVAARLEKLKHQGEVKALTDRQLQDQELQVFSVSNSYLQHQFKCLHQRHILLLGAFNNVKSVTFDEYISAEADKVARNQIEVIQKETENRMEALQSKIKELLAENASVKENNPSLSNVISTQQEEIGKLEVRVSTLTTDAKKSSTKIQELETTRDALNKALKESTQSLSVKVKGRSEIQSQYNTEKKRLEDELYALKNANEMLNEKLKKEEEERATLCRKIKSLENTNLSLMKTNHAKLEDIKKLEVHINTLTMDAKKSSAKIQELETARDALDKALKESTQSLSVKTKELSEIQSQYNTEKKRLEDELCAFRKANEMLNGKLKKEEEEKQANRKKEEEIKRKKEEEKVRNDVQPRNNTQWWGTSSAVFAPITCTESICEYMVKAGLCCYRLNALDINKFNVLAVAYDKHSVYLYSEMNKKEEKLCTCQYDVSYLKWNQQGVLLAIGGWHNDNTNNTIQVWDIPNRKITKRLKINKRDQNCFCLDWNGNAITAGTSNYICHWNINDQDNDQDLQKNEALLPRNTIQSKYVGDIMTVQWSNCKSKLATITYNGDMCIYNEEFKLIHHIQAHFDCHCWPFLQWCPWDNQVIATYCSKGYLKIWRVQQNITLIKGVQHESSIKNMNWIPNKNAIVTAHENNQLVLWEYPSLNIIRIMNGHTFIPYHLALNADKSAVVSKSNKEMIFWKPFDQL